MFHQEGKALPISGFETLAHALRPGLARFVPDDQGGVGALVAQMHAQDELDARLGHALRTQVGACIVAQRGQGLREHRHD